MVMLGKCPCCGGEAATIKWDREKATFGWRYYAEVDCTCGLCYITPDSYETYDSALDAASEKWNAMSLQAYKNPI